MSKHQLVRFKKAQQKEEILFFYEHSVKYVPSYNTCL